MSTGSGELPRSLPWIDRLIRLDTTSRNSNLGLIEMVRDDLAAQGLQCWLTYDPGGTKANLFATLPAADGRVTGGVVLSGHTDVVPVDGQAWSSDPFSPEIRNGKLFGRGSADMKSFIGAVLSMVPRAGQMRLAEPLHLALSYDEEIGCVGAPSMIDEVQARGIMPRSCLVGEPTGMRVVVAHKGVNVYRCAVHGHSAHSSLTPQGVNAIEYAARLICFIGEMAEDFERDGPYDQGFDVPFSTAQTGLVKGGVALNMIPALCEFDFEVRNLPTVDPKALIARVEAYACEILLPQMRRKHGGSDILFKKLAVAPGLSEAERSEFVALVEALGRTDGLRKVSYGTEAGLFQRADIPSIICGPGEIAQAHKPDEFIELEQIARCETFLDKLVASMQQRD